MNEISAEGAIRFFIRNKYRIYKLEFPTIKEGELIQKIVKEWEGLSEA